jgi:hypothetical protein
MLLSARFAGVGQALPGSVVASWLQLLAHVLAGFVPVSSSDLFAA